MLSILLSTIAFFVAGYFIRRRMDDSDIPKGMTRSVLIFCLAAGISYAVAFAVSWATGS
jgi:VIT1/CCC1 family predicted Fe2+/Mn2+ transporter